MPEHQQEAVAKALVGETVRVYARSHPFSMDNGKTITIDSIEPAEGGAEISENVFWHPLGKWMLIGRYVNVELQHVIMTKETFAKVEKARKAA